MTDRISDKEQIKEVIEAAYDLQDMRQWARLEPYFVKHPYIDNQSLSGEAPAVVTNTSLISNMKRELTAYFYATKHFVRNLAVKVSGNRAKATTNVEKSHFVLDRSERYVWKVFGTYEFELVKKGGDWKIARMIFTLKDQSLRPVGSPA